MMTVDDIVDKFKWVGERNERNYDVTPEEILEDLDGVELLFAEYETSSYEGYAFVLWRDGDELWFVEGEHCSCYGLEGQWHPERTNKEALLNRQFYGIDGVKEQVQALADAGKLD